MSRIDEIKQEYLLNPKLCGGCGFTIPFSNRRKGKFCSRSCAAKTNNSIYPKRNQHLKGISLVEIHRKYKQKTIYVKTCSGCFSNFETKIPTRQYCKSSCKSNKIFNDSVAQFKTGVLTKHQTARKCMIFIYGSACSLCGWDEKNIATGNTPIELDHIDGNSQNTTINNLRLLCPNCHSLQPTYKALNWGNGRVFRKDRYQSGKSY